MAEMVMKLWSSLIVGLTFVLVVGVSVFVVMAVAELVAALADRFISRPMTFVEHRFTDRITGKVVNLYICRQGKQWLSTNRWGTDRMPRPEPVYTKRHEQ